MAAAFFPKRLHLMKTGLATVAALFAVAFPALACEGPVAVCDGAGPGVALVRGGKPVTVYVDADAEKPVARVAGDFAADLGRVSGADAAIVHSLDGAPGDVVVIGEIGHSRLIDGWIKAGKLDVSAIRGQWEAYAQQVIDLAMQMHGGGGMTNDFPLAAMWTNARALRLADGPDEVHRGLVARHEIGKHRS